MAAPKGFRFPFLMGLTLLGGGLSLWLMLVAAWLGASGAFSLGDSLDPDKLDDASPTISPSSTQWPEGEEKDEDFPILQGPWWDQADGVLKARNAFNFMPNNSNGGKSSTRQMDSSVLTIDQLDSLALHGRDTDATINLNHIWSEANEGTHNELLFARLTEPAGSVLSGESSSADFDNQEPPAGGGPSNDDSANQGPSGDPLESSDERAEEPSSGPSERRLAEGNMPSIGLLADPMGRLGHVNNMAHGVPNTRVPRERRHKGYHNERDLQSKGAPPYGPTGGSSEGGGGDSGSSGGMDYPRSQQPHSPSRGSKAPHEYYHDSKNIKPLPGLRWASDSRVLQPEILKGLVTEQGKTGLAKEKTQWQNSHGFFKEVTVTSKIRKGHKYKIIFTDFLGSGGIGIVLSAIEVATKKRLAVKICRLQKSSHRNLNRAPEILRRRSKEEIGLWKYVPHGISAQQWSQMSQIVIPIDMVEPTEDFISNDENVKYSNEWVISELFAGDLESNEGVWKGNMVTKIEVTKQVIFATMSLHSMGVVHSDIKPPNFLMHPDGRIYVGDNSLCTPINQNTACLNGTMHYLPPENLRCLLYHQRRIVTSERKDSWAIGVLLFRLFCSALPFEIRGMWPSEAAAIIGNATTADLDFTGCDPDTPLLIMGLIRVLLTPAVTLRPTLRDIYLHHPLFGMSNAEIAAGMKVRDVEEAVVREHPHLAEFVAHG